MPASNHHHQRFEDALASGRLKELAKEMTAEGWSQAAIYVAFEAFWEYLNAAPRPKDAALLHDCLDAIVGQCNPARKWFAQNLTPDDIYEYRRQRSNN